MKAPRNVFESLVRLHEAATNASLMPHGPFGPLQKGFSEVVAHLHMDVKPGGARPVVVADKKQVRIQTTETSMSRTSGAEPHLVNDKLKYILMIGKTPGKGGVLPENLSDFIASGAELERLVAAREKLVSRLGKVVSEMRRRHLSTEAGRLGAVASYLLKRGESHVDAAKRICKDISSQVGGKGGGKPLKECLSSVQSDCAQLLVRWSVDGIPLWGDSPMDAFASYWSDAGGEFDETNDGGNERFSPFEGRMARPRPVHPRIRLGDDKLKIFSAPSESNYTCGFTWKGMFDTREQAASMSEDVSHKIHAAVEWLFSRRQYASLFGDSVHFSWLDGGTEFLPLGYGGIVDENPEGNGGAVSRVEDEYADDADEMADETESPSEPEAPSAECAPWSPSNLRPLIDSEFGNMEVRRVRQKLRSEWRGGKIDGSRIVRTLSLRKSSVSTAAVVGYSTDSVRDVLDSVCSFDEKYAWKVRLKIETPDDSPNDEARKEKTIVVYGTRSPEWYATAATPGAKDGNEYRNRLAEEIFRARIEGRNFPSATALKIAERVEREAPGKSHRDVVWNDMFGALCGIVAGERGISGMSKDERFKGVEELSDRSVLMGRLFAVYDDLERYVLRMDGHARATAVEREMRNFRMYPAESLLRVQDRTTPYRLKLVKERPGMEAYYSAMESEILGKFWENATKNGDVLSGESVFGTTPLDLGYSLGFHAQRELIREHMREKDAEKKAAEKEKNAA